MPSPAPGLQSLFQGVVSRLVVYYAALFTIVWGGWSVLSTGTRASLSSALAPILGGGGGSVPTGPITSILPPVDALAPLSPRLVTLLVVVACLSAILLTLPVAWVYMFTRQKKGYSQSVVHTLILLPAVVAAVAVLVRNSIALAFSLAGIVAAVRFRTTLEDSKDAVYVFTVVALGLACGVQLEVAVVLSLLYILVALVLWQTDFARTPPALEGKRAEQHMQRAIAIANRTSQFVARLDREILETMAPEQLDALAGRVRKRRNATAGMENGDEDDDRPRFEGRLNVTVTSDDAAQAAVEGVLTARTKRWQLVRRDVGDGETLLVYAVRPRRGMQMNELAEAVTRDGTPYVARVQVEQWA